MSKVNLNILVFLCALIIALAGQGADGVTIHVPDDYSTIQEAIDAASDFDEIEVAPGDYSETINFLGLKIRLYSSGGPEVTTIDGDNALHTVLCRFGEDANTILEGFTITGGNANGTDYGSKGGGMLNRDGSSPTVIDCNFMANDANYGGGMCNTDGSSPTVINCNFSGNSAVSFGSGMYNENSSNPTVTNCSFSGNSAEWGGGMANHSSSPTVTNCTFTGNTTVNDGGGMYNYPSSGPTVTNCTFSGNSAADRGGGMYSHSGSPTVTNCSFTGNSADYGGGMSNGQNSNTTVTNCIFHGNDATTNGGGMFNYDNSDPILTNCILWANVKGQIAGNLGSVTYSCIQDWASGGTGNINVDPNFLDAAGGDFRFISSGSPCVDTGNNSVVTEPNDLAGNPRVVDGDLDSTPTVDMGVYELQPKQIHNITQNTWYERIQTVIDDSDNGDQIEVGPDTYYEAINFSGMAIELYSSGGPLVTIIDANGIAGAYHAVQCVSGEDANTILEGFTITGGYAKGPNYPDRDGGGMYNLGSSPTVTNCIIKNNQADHGGGMLNVDCNPTVTNCIFKNNTASDSAFGGGGMYNHNSSPVLTGCTFIGNSGGPSGGGGMFNASSSNPTMTNCTFSGNEATNDGGGMYNYDNSSPTVSNCTFTGNTASSDTYGGGGMFNYSNSNPTVTNCNFSGNEATNGGGGMYNYSSSNPTVINCNFSGNEATNDGGGMCNYNNSSPTVSNCVFTGNTSSGTYGGGGMLNTVSCNPTLTNCTFSGNSAEGLGGGGMYNFDGIATVTNCILWGDTPDEIYNYSGSTPIVTYSDVESGTGQVWFGTGCIDADPCFVDVNNPDPNLVNLRLLPDSPCIDAADSTAVPSGLFLDLDGNPRGVDDPQTPNTGVSVLGITVDMGAYELNPCIPGDNNCDGMVNFIDLAILCNNWLVGAE